MLTLQVRFALKIFTAFAVLANLEVATDDVIAGVLAETERAAVGVRLVAVFALELAAEWFTRA